MFSYLLVNPSQIFFLGPRPPRGARNFRKPGTGISVVGRPTEGSGRALLAPTWQAQQTRSPAHFDGSVEIIYFLLNQKNKTDFHFKENVFIYNN